jgi:hypothetical protein
MQPLAGDVIVSDGGRKSPALRWDAAHYHQVNDIFGLKSILPLTSIS